MNGDAAIKSVPWVVLVLTIIETTDSREEFKCTGNLITDEHVITAGHCYCKKEIVDCALADKVIPGYMFNYTCLQLYLSTNVQ